MLHSNNKTKEAEFRELYVQHRHLLFSYVYNILGDHARAEDITQDIFINVWDRFDELDIREPRAYLMQAARFQCARYFKRNQFTHVQLDTVVDIINRHELDLSREETEELIKQITVKADSLLPEKCRQVFELRFYHQLTNKEIAEKLGLSVSTVENQINKALKLLRFSLSQQAGVVLLTATIGLSIQ
jgi:RNA polymerase sigma-70 factor (ECF subfamily)